MCQRPRSTKRIQKHALPTYKCRRCAHREHNRLQKRGRGLILCRERVEKGAREGKLLRVQECFGGRRNRERDRKTRCHSQQQGRRTLKRSISEGETRSLLGKTCCGCWLICRRCLKALLGSCARKNCTHPGNPSQSPHPICVGRCRAVCRGACRNLPP